MQSVGGFKGDAQDAPSKVNQVEKLRLLRSEGVTFDEKLVLADETKWWDGFDVRDLENRKWLKQKYSSS